MAKYESRFKSLGFYVGGELKRFNNGIYTTVNKDDIAVLDGLSDAARIDEPQATKQTEAKPAPKAPAKRTASAK